MFKSLFLISVLCFIYIDAGCPPSKDKIDVVVKFLEKKLNEIKKLEPGINKKDADFVVQKVIKNIVNSNKFAPCADGFKWEQLEPEINKIRDACYSPADYSKEKTQKDFMDCAKPRVMPLVLKFSGPGMKACDCFDKTIIPKWDSDYKAKAEAYVNDFKTLKHRK